MSTLVLVRHGQAMFLAENYDQLSELGERQSRLLGEYWGREGERFSAFYSGPLERQKGTAFCVHEALANAGISLAEPTIMDEFNEYPGITMTKKLLPKLIAERPELAKMLETPPGADPGETKKRFQKVFQIVMGEWLEGKLVDDSIETWDSFITRVQTGFAELMARHPKGARIALFASGGVISAILQRVLGLDNRTTIEHSWVIKNASLSELLYTPEKVTMIGFNATPHLTEQTLITYR